MNSRRDGEDTLTLHLLELGIVGGEEREDPLRLAVTVDVQLQVVQHRAETERNTYQNATMSPVQEVAPWARTLTSCRAYSRRRCCWAFGSTARLRPCSWTGGRRRGVPRYSGSPGPAPPATRWPPRSSPPARTEASPSGPPGTSAAGDGDAQPVTQRVTRHTIPVFSSPTDIFAVEGTFVQLLHRLDVLDADGAQGLLPCRAPGGGTTHRDRQSVSSCYTQIQAAY